MNDDIICKGCYALGSACGWCSRCRGEVQELYAKGSVPEASHEAAMAWGRSIRDKTGLPQSPFSIKLVEDLLLEMAQRRSALRNLLVGRKVRIVKDWRDQPWGHSKKNLNGTTQVISNVYVGERSFSLALKGLRCSIGPEKVVFLDGSPDVHVTMVAH